MRPGAKLAAFRKRAGRWWPLSARGTFLLPLALFLEIGARFWWRDEVANALALLLGALLSVQFLFVALARWRLPAWIRLPDTPPPESRPDAPPRATGWAWTHCPWWLRLGLCEPVFPDPIWIDPADGTLRALCPRRGEMRLSSEGGLQDALGLIHWPLRWPTHLVWLIVPPRPLDPVLIPQRLSPAGDRWDPAGRPDGDWFDIKPAEPQTPRRLLLWKLSAKTGTDATLRRAPEPVGTSVPQTGILLILSPTDEAAAAVVRAWMEDADEAWVYADSAAPRSLLERRHAASGEALTRLARSGTPPSPVASPAEVLAAFLEEAAARRLPLSRIFVFAGSSDPPLPPPRSDLALSWFQVSEADEAALDEVSRQGTSAVFRLRCRLRDHRIWS